MGLFPEALAAEPYCYVTTTGRRTGRQHTIEIWFGHGGGDTLYIMAGGRERSDTVRNLRAAPDARVRVGDVTFAARARILPPEADEDGLARRLLLAKYAPGYAGGLDSWGRTALPVALDLVAIVSRNPAHALWPKRRRRG
jgi:deazaflavin-dependent oxidoreductase (nitroreductase family)